MKALAETVFLSEIVFQARIAERAASRLGDQTSDVDHVDVWSAIQSILVAAGNVSKILWPSEKNAERGEHLRKLLSVDDGNPLKSRKLRNHFEHYDERIQSWFEESGSVVYLDPEIRSSAGHLISMPRASHRSFDPTTMTVTFRGETTDLKGILSALREIRERCGRYVLNQ